MAQAARLYVLLSSVAAPPTRSLDLTGLLHRHFRAKTLSSVLFRAPVSNAFQYWFVFVTTETAFCIKQSACRLKWYALTLCFPGQLTRPGDHHK